MKIQSCIGPMDMLLVSKEMKITKALSGSLFQPCTWHNNVQYHWLECHGTGYYYYYLLLLLLIACKLTFECDQMRVTSKIPKNYKQKQWENYIHHIKTKNTS